MKKCIRQLSLLPARPFAEHLIVQTRLICLLETMTNHKRPLSSLPWEDNPWLRKTIGFHVMRMWLSHYSIGSNCANSLIIKRCSIIYLPGWVYYVSLSSVNDAASILNAIYKIELGWNLFSMMKKMYSLNAKWNGQVLLIWTVFLDIIAINSISRFCWWSFSVQAGTLRRLSLPSNCMKIIFLSFEWKSSSILTRICLEIGQMSTVSFCCNSIQRASFRTWSQVINSQFVFNSARFLSELLEIQHIPIVNMCWTLLDVLQ